MKIIKRMRSTRSKLLKGQMAAGGEFYYSKKPSQRRTDYVVAKAKPAQSPVKVETVRVKKK